MNSIEQLEALKKQVIELQEKLNKLTWNYKWEPKGGDFYISVDGIVMDCHSDNEARLFGTERETKELAEKAAINMRQFNRLLAYRDEVVDETNYTKAFIQGARNTYVTYDHSIQEYATVEYLNNELIGIPSFPPHIAEALVQKLNLGEVEL